MSNLHLKCKPFSFQGHKLKGGNNGAALENKGIQKIDVANE